MSCKKILFGAAIIGTAQSAMLLPGNQNFGNVLVYGLTAGCWAYSLNYEAVNRLCSKGFWTWARRIVILGLTVLFGLAFFVAMSGRNTTATGDEQAIIVLGAGLKGTKPSAMLARRLDAAYNVWKDHPEMPIVVSGGQGKDEVISEAQAMAEYLKEKGVPQSKILQENQSTSTKENFEFSQKLLWQNGIDTQKPIAFATSDFHCWRAQWFAQKMGFSQIRRIPAPTPWSRLIPSWLREAAGVAYYTIFDR